MASAFSGRTVANSIATVVIHTYWLPKKVFSILRNQFPVGIAVESTPAMAFEIVTTMIEKAKSIAISRSEISFRPQYFAARVLPSSASVPCART